MLINVKVTVSCRYKVNGCDGVHKTRRSEENEENVTVSVDILANVVIGFI